MPDDAEALRRELRAMEAKWLAEKMNAKKDAAHAAKRLGEALTEIERLSRCLAQETERADAVGAEHLKAVTESAQKDTEIAALRQRVEASDRAIAECVRYHIDPREDSP